MNFTILVVDVFNYLVCTVNGDTILTFYDGEAKQFEVVPFLEGVIKHSVKFLAQVGETISMLGSKDNLVRFVREDGLMVVVEPIEDRVVQATADHIQCDED